MAVESDGLLVQPQRRFALQLPSSQFPFGVGVAACVVPGVIWPPLAAAFASSLLPAASVVNDALFAAGIVRGLAADDPASDERKVVCEDLERDVRVRDLDPVLLTESCGFISLSALENHSSSVR